MDRLFAFNDKMQTDLKYRYHDGWISAVTIGPRRAITLQVILDSVWNGNVEKIVTVRFGGIENFDAIVDYCQVLATDCEDDPNGGRRIDALHRDVGTVLTGGGLWFVFEAEGLGKTEIHCRSVQEMEEKA